MIVAGIDPGAKGALVIIDSTRIVAAHLLAPLLELGKLAATLRASGCRMIFCERSQAFPGQGVSSSFQYGATYGEVIGTLKALPVPHVLVTPAKWARWAHTGVPVLDCAKKRSAVAAQRLYPTFDFRATARSTKPHDGIIDASLIAAWGLHVHLSHTDIPIIGGSTARSGSALFAQIVDEKEFDS